MRTRYLDEQGRTVVIKRVRVPVMRSRSRYSRRGELINFLGGLKRRKKR